MSDENTSITIQFGALAPSIAVQLTTQKLPFDDKKVKLYERLKESMTLLYFQNLLNDSEFEKVRNKLFTQIKKHVNVELKKRGSNPQSEIKNPKL